MRPFMIHNASFIMIDHRLVTMAAKNIGLDFNEPIWRNMAG